MSLIQTTKLDGYEPLAYLADVLTLLPTQPMSRTGAAGCIDRSIITGLRHIAVLSTVWLPERQNRCPPESSGHLFWRLEALNCVDGWPLTAQ